MAMKVSCIIRDSDKTFILARALMINKSARKDNRKIIKPKRRYKKNRPYLRVIKLSIIKIYFKESQINYVQRERCEGSRSLIGRISCS